MSTHESKRMYSDPQTSSMIFGGRPNFRVAPSQAYSGLGLTPQDADARMHLVDVGPEETLKDAEDEWLWETIEENETAEEVVDVKENRSSHRAASSHGQLPCHTRIELSHLPFRRYYCPSFSRPQRCSACRPAINTGTLGTPNRE